MEHALEVKFHLGFHWVTPPWRRTLTNGRDVKDVFPRCPVTHGRVRSTICKMSCGNRHEGRNPFRPKTTLLNEMLLGFAALVPALRSPQNDDIQRWRQHCFRESMSVQCWPIWTQDPWPVDGKCSQNTSIVLTLAPQRYQDRKLRPRSREWDWKLFVFGDQNFTGCTVKVW